MAAAFQGLKCEECETADATCVNVDGVYSCKKCDEELKVKMAARDWPDNKGKNVHHVVANIGDTNNMVTLYCAECSKFNEFDRKLEVKECGACHGIFTFDDKQQ